MFLVVDHRKEFYRFTTSQTVIQRLESGQKWMTFLTTVSAFAASIGPLVGKDSIASHVFSAIGVVAAALSGLVYGIGLVLKWIEGNSHKYRNE